MAFNTAVFWASLNNVSEVIGLGPESMPGHSRPREFLGRMLTVSCGTTYSGTAAVDRKSPGRHQAVPFFRGINRAMVMLRVNRKQRESCSEDGV